MPSTLFVLVLLLSAQLGDRYPAESDGSSSEPAAATEPRSQAQVSDESGAQEPPPASSSAFDEIDTRAEPLNSATQSSPTVGQSEGQQATTAPSGTPAPPAATQTPAADVESEMNPAKVLAGLLEPPLEQQLQGTPLALAQAIESAVNRAEQTQRVVAYWELSQAVANYYLAYKERTELAALRQSVSLPGVDWDTARQNSEERLQLAGDRVRAAQEYLGQLMGSAMPGFAPLPNDLPFCGPYETRYGQIFQNRSSALAEQLNELLPRLHKDLTARTQEIAAARTWMFRVSDNRGPQTDGYELLKSYELFAARRRMFISAVKEYNLGIVRYTEIATPGTLETERLVAMLIRTGGSQATTYDADVQRAGAEESADPNDSSSTQPVDPGVSGWTPVRSSSAERSILVPRS